jgi:Zn-dependent protease
MILRFRLGSIPVNVHPAFFLVAVFLGIGGNDLAVLASWIGVVFVSVLLHELGHAAAGRAFGLSPQIDLHGMGGTTSWTAVGRPLSSGQRIVVSLAGPVAGLAVGGGVFALAAARVIPATAGWSRVVSEMLFVNVGWGVLNLLPMLPLDGGNVMRQALGAVLHERADRVACIVSIVVAAVCAPLAFLYYSTWAALMAAYFAVMNVRALAAMRPAGPPLSAPAP